jgi:putative membrane protein
MMGGMMGGGMFFGFLFMILILGMIIFLVYWLLNRGKKENSENPLELLKIRYAKGEITEEEFTKARENLK